MAFLPVSLVRTDGAGDGFTNPNLKLQLQRDVGIGKTVVIGAPAACPTSYCDSWAIQLMSGVTGLQVARFLTASDTYKPNGSSIECSAICSFYRITMAAGCVQPSDVITWVVDSKPASVTAVLFHDTAQNPHVQLVDVRATNAADGEFVLISARLNGSTTDRFGPQIKLLVKRSAYTTTLTSWGSQIANATTGVVDLASIDQFKYPASPLPADNKNYMFFQKNGTFWNPQDEMSFVVTQLSGTSGMTLTVSTGCIFHFISFPSFPGPFGTYSGSSFSLQLKVNGVNTGPPAVWSCST